MAPPTLPPRLLLPLLLVLALTFTSLGQAHGEMTAADITSGGHVSVTSPQSEEAMLAAGISQHQHRGDRDDGTTAALLKGDDDQEQGKMNDSDSPSIDDDTILAFAGDTFLEARKHQEAHPEVQRPYYAACPYFDKLMSAFWGCQFLQASRGIMTRSCGNFSSIFSIKEPANPTGLWPESLTDLRPDPPFEVPKALVAHERGTFYWLYRHINNLYEYAYQEEGNKTAPWPPVPPGWSEQRLHYVHETNVRLVFENFIDTPLATTMMNRDRNTMLVVIRGTLSAQEWNFDYQVRLLWVWLGVRKGGREGERIALYFPREKCWRKILWMRDDLTVIHPTPHARSLPPNSHSPPPSLPPHPTHPLQYQFAEGQARQDFPGRVHQGVYNVYTLFAEEILAEVARLQPFHVFVTGHSLGGALTHLLSYTIANRHPGISVDGVAFASIMMADECLMAAIREKVNLRNVFYLGKGQDGHMYRVGDLIPQATWYV